MNSPQKNHHQTRDQTNATGEGGVVVPSDDEIRKHLRLGEDSRWEFKSIEFKGNRPSAPRRDDLADELSAFANAEGGILLCGVTDEGEMPGMSREEMTSLDRHLIEISTASIEPSLRIRTYHRELDGKAFILVVIPRGDSSHGRRDGSVYVRVGASKRKLSRDEALRLQQDRVQSRYLWYDRQIVPHTGFQTLEPKYWEPLLSATASSHPQQGLLNQHLLASDHYGQDRATVAGILFCTSAPQQWLPHAMITATQYRGEERSSGQLDAQEITGPLHQQIAKAIRFVVRNMRVSARKTPAREDCPQCSEEAVFEGIVNAVVHRDYSLSERRIRLSMFQDRLEIESPGSLMGGMTIHSMESSQATRNETITSIFKGVPVRDMAGSGSRQFLMERRGDGVSVIRNKTYDITGCFPSYELLDGASALVLRIPAAKPDIAPMQARVMVHDSQGQPLQGIDVLCLFPNKTWIKETTDAAGYAEPHLHTGHLPMTVYVAAPGYRACLKQGWIPQKEGLVVNLEAMEDGGSMIFTDSTGHLPGLTGRLNPILDTHDRAYLYAHNVSINEGQQQPVSFLFGKALHLTDAYGAKRWVTFLHMLQRSALLEYRQSPPKELPSAP